MNYVLIIKPDGTKVRYPANDKNVIPAKPGDEIIILDPNGLPADVDLKAIEDDLLVTFRDSSTVTLQNFYHGQDALAPVTIGIKPTAEDLAEYEFNSTIGNMPGEGEFTLMHFSSTSGLGFDDPGAGRLAGFSGDAAGAGGFNGAEPEDKAPTAGEDGAGIGGAAEDFAMTTESASVIVDLLANDSDPEGGSLTITEIQGIPISAGQTVTLQSGSQVTLNNDGTVTYAPGDDFEALGKGDQRVDTFVYTIADQGGNVVSSTASVTVLGENDGPVATNDFARGLEDQPIFTIPVLNNDTDVDGDALSIVGTPSATNGVVSVNPDGTINYVPNQDFNGADTISYIITDPSGAVSTATVTVVVEAVNDAPVSTPVTATTNEDTPITADPLASATDVDGDTLSISGTPTAPNGTVVVNMDGTITYTPDPDFHGTDVITYTIDDGNGGTLTTTMEVTVNPVNDAPVGVNDIATTDEDSPIYNLPVLGNDTDVDGDTLSVQGTPTATNGTVTVNADGTLNYVPNPNFNGTDTISYVVTDGNGASDTATVTVTVNAVNDAPVANPDTATVAEDTPLTNFDILSNDTDLDGDTLSVSGTPVADNGTVTVNMDGTINYTPDPDFNGTDTITYVVTDPSGATSTSTVTVTVTPANDAPVAVNDVATTDEDQTIFNLPAMSNDSDIDGDTISIQGTPTAPNGTVTVNPDGTLNYTPNANFNGVDTISYTITDGNGLTDTATVAVTVNAVNDDPVANPDTATVAEDTPLTNLNILGNDTDTDGDMLSVSGTPVADNGTVTVNMDGTINYTPDSDFTGTDTITYVITDPSGATSTSTVAVTVTPVNDAPVGVNDSATTNEDQPVFNLDVIGNDTDPDGDALSVQGTPTATNGTVTVNPDGTINYMPNANFNGVDTITYVVTDGNGESDTATVSVTVNAQNDPPIAINDTASTNEDTAIPSINVLGNDSSPDGGMLSVTNAVAQNGTVGINMDGTLAYTPNADFHGTDYISYTITDSNGETATATVVVTVASVNDAPEGDPAAGIVKEDEISVVSGQLSATDADGDTPAFTAATNAAGTNGFGAFSIDSNGTWSYQLNNSEATVDALKPGETLTDTYTYTVSDGNGGTDTETITVTIQGTNDAPELTDNTACVHDENVLVDSGNLITDNDGFGQDSDSEGDTLNVVGIDGLGIDGPATLSGKYGTLVVDADGSYSYTIDGNNANVIALGEGESLQESFTYTVTDGVKTGETATLSGLYNTGVDDSGNALAVGTEDPHYELVTHPAGEDDASQVHNHPWFTNDADSASLGSGGGVGFYRWELDFEVGPNADLSSIFGEFLASGDDGVMTVYLNGTALTSTGTGLIGGATNAPSYTLDNSSPLILGTNTLAFEVNNTVGQVALHVEFTTPTTYDVLETSEADLLVKVLGTNDSPVAEASAGIVKEDEISVVSGQLSSSDPDGDAVGYTVAANVAGTAGYGTFNVDANGAWSYSLNNGNTTVDALKPGETLTDTYTFTVSDGNGGTDTETITVTIEGTNDGPVAVPDVASTNEDTPITNLNILGNDTDADGDTLSLVGVPSAQNGTVTVNMDGTINYTPAADYNGTDVINYIITDGNGETSTSTVTVTVNPVNDAPVGNPAAGNVQEEIQPHVSGQLAATDVDGDTVAFTPVTSGAGTGGFGGFNVDASGAWNYVLDDSNPAVDALAPGETITDTYTYTVNDGNGLSDTETITVTIYGSNDPPTGMTLDMDCIDENVMYDINSGTGEQAGMAVGTLSTQSIDTGDTYTYEVVEDDPLQYNWFTIGGPNGDQIVVKNDTDLNHEIREFHDVKVRVTDSGGETFIETFTIQVKDVNEAPQNFIISLAGELDGNDESINSAEIISADPSPDLVALSDGGYVKIYTAMREEGGGEGRFVMAQRYDDESEEVGSPLQISTTEVPTGSSAETITLADGSFVIAFEIEDGNGGSNVAFQRFDNTFSPTGTETTVNTATLGVQENVSMHALSGGGFAVAWENASTGEVSNRVYDGSGAPVSAQTNAFGQTAPQVGALAAGGYVVVHEAADGNGNGIFAQEYDATGGAVGAAFQISETTLGEQGNPRVVTRNGGEIAVVWNETRADGTSAIMFRDLDATGAPSGSERELTTDATGELVLDDIIALQDGGYFISYTDVTDSTTGQGDVLGWRINPVGDPVSQAADNAEARGSHSDSSLVELTDGDMIFAWESHKNNATGDDRSAEHIHRNFIGQGTATGSIPRDGIDSHVLSEGGNFTPEVAGLATGGYMTFWRSQNVDGDGWALLGQEFNEDGVKVGTAFTVNDSATGDQGHPSAAQLKDGGFVLAFESDGEILVQRYTGNGNLLGGNTVVNTTLTGAQEKPAIAALPDGGYVVAWHSQGQGIVTQQFTNEGIEFGGETVTSTATADTSVPVSVAGTENGEIVLTWSNENGEISGRRFAGPGNPLGLEFTVNSSLAGEQTGSKVAALSNVGFIITWASDGGEDGDGGSILAQRYNIDGSVNGSEFVVNSSGTNTQNNPEIIGLEDGGFIIAWESDHRTDNTSEVWGQRFNVDGSPRAAEFQISIDTNNGAVSERQGIPAATQLVNGNIVFTWHAEDSRGTIEDGPRVRLFEQMASEDDIGPVLVATLGSDDIDEGDTHTYTLNSVNAGPIREDDGMPAYTAAELTDMFELRNGNEVWLKDGRTFDNLAQFVQEFEINLTVEDQGGLSLTDDVIISINGGRDNPTNITIDDGDTFGVTDDDTTATVADGATGGTVVGSIGVEDVDIDDSHTFSIVEEDENEYHIFEIVNGNEIAVKAGFETAAEERETHFVTVRVTDALGLTYDEVITVNVNRPNEAPTQINLSPIGEFEQSAMVVSASDTTTNTPFDPYARVVALDDGTGDYLMFYSSHDAGRSMTTFGQRFNEDGTAIGSPTIIQSATWTINGATLLSDGNVLVLDRRSLGTVDIEFRVLDPSDLTNVIVPRTTLGTISGALSNTNDFSVEALDNGRFVVAFDQNMPGAAGREVFLKIFENDGTPVTSEIQVNQFTAGVQGRYNEVVETPDGGFMVLWDSQGADGSSYGVSARKYDNNGVPQANEFVVNQTTASDQYDMSAIGLNNGNILVTYSSNPDSNSLGIIGMIIDQNGAVIANEFQINSTETNQQRYPETIALDDGGFFVQWSDLSDGNWNIKGQRFDSAGTPLGSEIELINDPANQYSHKNTSAQLVDGNLVIIGRDDEGAGLYHKIIQPDGTVVHDPADVFVDTKSFEYRPSIISLNDGTFVSFHSNGDVRQVRLDSDGNPLSTVERVNTVTRNSQYRLRATALNDGGYVVVWDSNDDIDETDTSWASKMQRYNAAGEKLGDEVLVNTYTESNQLYSEVAGLENGGWVVTWSSNGQDGSNYGVFMQQFDSDGRRMGVETQVNTTTNGHQIHSAVAGLDDGGFIITFMSENVDGSGYAIMGQRYNSDGTTNGTEFQVNDLTAASQYYPTVTGLENGGFAITWHDNNTIDGNDNGVAVKVYDAAGMSTGQITVNTDVAGPQMDPRITSLDDGGFVITWMTAPTRADLVEVHAQRYDATGTPVGAERTVSQNSGNASMPDVAQGPDGTIMFVYHFSGETGGHDIRTVTWNPGVLETVAAGSVVAELSATDANNESGTETAVYTLITDASNLFEISGNQLKLKAGSVLDYETATSHTVTIEVEDSAGNTYQQDVTFDVVDVAMAPIVIDLDGDGAEFRNIEDGAKFDTDGDGDLEQTAWAGEDDALLVYDKNDDGDITDTDEISFTGYLEGAETDLEGLRAFDTDDDGLLSSSDAEWERFHLWNDANSDGIVDEGELSGLSESGVESIGLTSDGESYDAESGDVHVHGEAEVTFSDGSTGTAADSEFDFRELVDESGDAPLEVVTESGDILNLDETDTEAPLGTADPGPGEVIVPESSPTASIDEQAANDAAMP